VIGGGASVRRSPLGGLVGGLVAWDADMTRDPAVLDGDTCSTECGLSLVGPKRNLLAWAFVYSPGCTVTEEPKPSDT
jgi:hypothetical protein